MMQATTTAIVFSERTIEKCTAVVLAVAALATSWSGYQATLWNGDQLRLMTQAQQKLQCGSRASAAAGQHRTVDVVSFVSWLSARAANEQILMQFYERRFRPELRTAFEAWLASRPIENPSAAATPFLLPQYHLAAEDTVTQCNAESTRAILEANDANRIGDRYVFATVVFAIALFFAGGMSGLQARWLRITTLGVGVLATAAGLLLLMRLPPG